MVNRKSIYWEAISNTFSHARTVEIPGYGFKNMITEYTTKYGYSNLYTHMFIRYPRYLNTINAGCSIIENNHYKLFLLFVRATGKKNDSGFRFNVLMSQSPNKKFYDLMNNVTISYSMINGRLLANDLTGLKKIIDRVNVERDFYASILVHTLEYKQYRIFRFLLGYKSQILISERIMIYAITTGNLLPVRLLDRREPEVIPSVITRVMSSWLTTTLICEYYDIHRFLIDTRQDSNKLKAIRQFFHQKDNHHV
jgi:hypothetical protein